MHRFVSKGKVEKSNISERLLSFDIIKNIRYLKQITFEVTERCNLACAYCAYGKYYNFASGRTRNDIPFVYIEYFFMPTFPSITQPDAMDYLANYFTKKHTCCYNHLIIKKKNEKIQLFSLQFEKYDLHLHRQIFLSG